MTTTDPQPDRTSDGSLCGLDEQSLLAAAREGSCGALAVLYTEHRAHAVAVARRALAGGDPSLAEDVAEIAFVRVFQAIANGGGPRDTLRHYLATSVRREAWRTQRRQRRQAELADRWAADEPVVSEPEPPRRAGRPDPGGHALLAQAFGGLPDRWRHVLWLAEVEGRRPAEVAEILGMSAGAAAALAYRARQGLLRRYVAVHRMCAPDAACRALAPALERYLIGGRDAAAHPDVAAHLDGCRRCRDVCRGIDVVGESTLAVVPLALLSAGWWAQAAATTSSGAALAGAAVAGSAAAAGAAGSASAGAGASGAGVAGAAGTTGLVAAAAAAVVVAGALVAGALGLGSRSGRPEAADAPGAAEAPAAVGGVPSGGADEVVVSSEQIVPVDPPAVGPAPEEPGPPEEPAAPAALPVRPPDRVTAPTTSTTSTTSSSVPSSTTSTTAATTAPTTTTTTTPVAPTTVPPTTTTTTADPGSGWGWVAGRIVAADPDRPGRLAPLDDVVVRLDDAAGRPVRTVRTGRDGRYAFAWLPSGTYRVWVEVPAGLVPRDHPDQGAGGTWLLDLGSVRVERGIATVDDLVLDRPATTGVMVGAAADFDEVIASATG